MTLLGWLLQGLGIGFGIYAAHLLTKALEKAIEKLRA